MSTTLGSYCIAARDAVLAAYAEWRDAMRHDSRGYSDREQRSHAVLLVTVCVFLLLAVTGSAAEMVEQIVPGEPVKLGAAGPGAVTVYDNLGTATLAGYSQLNTDSPVYGDSLTFTQGGMLSQVGLSLFNPTSGGNVGSILQGTMLISIYDNTTPYSGKALSLPLLGSGSVDWDFTSIGGIPAGYYVNLFVDATPLGVTLPTDILITQQFTETSGTSTRNGVILYEDPILGTSPNTVYISSSSTPEGLYTFTGNPGQFGYQIEVETTDVPDSSNTLALAVLAFSTLAALRRRLSAHE